MASCKHHATRKPKPNKPKPKPKPKLKPASLRRKKSDTKQYSIHAYALYTLKRHTL